MSTWKIEHDRTNVVCPDCAFSFDAIHQDGDGGYTCPLCEPVPAEATERCSFPGCGAASTGKLDGSVPLCDEHARAVGVPASGEPSGADAAVREALDAIKKAHTAVDDLCSGNSWTMSIPARPDADHDLVIDDALTKAERVIRSLANVPTAPGAPEEGRCGLPSPVRRYGPCILRRGHGGPGAHQHDETGRIMQAYHAPGYYRQWAEERQREWAEEGPDTSEEGAGE